MTDTTKNADVLPVNLPTGQIDVRQDDAPDHNGESWHPTLGGLAGLMKQESGNRLELEVALHLELTANKHTEYPGRDGAVCLSCGLGDTPWPCMDWRSAYEVAVVWLMGRAGLGDVREVS